MSTARITLDNPAFNGRFRDFGRGSHFVRSAAKPAAPKEIADVYHVTPPKALSIQTSQQRREPVALPTQPRQTRSQVLQRGIMAQPTFDTPKAKTTFFTTQKLLVGMASLVFIAGLSVAALGFKTNKQVEAQLTNPQSNSAFAQVDEDKPSNQAIANHTVNPLHPRYIRIAKLGVMARVTSQGLDKNGKLKAPANVHDVGWFNQSSKPGEGGAVLLDSHVSGPTVRGAFYKIKDLKAGDKVEVERGDGQKFTYQVVKGVLSEADKTDMASALVSVEEGKPGLNMITCAGKFDPATQNYSQRLIVFAVQI